MVKKWRNCNVFVEKLDFLRRMWYDTLRYMGQKPRASGGMDAGGHERKGGERMSGKTRRIVSFVLALVMIATLAVPQQVGAVSVSASGIERQIIRLYKEARSLTGRYSFDGYCGTLVNAQLKLLGITTKVVGNNGNQEYDCYAAQRVTSGGFRTQSFSAKSYTLLEALNALTEGGTVDVTNVLVGFQQTRSSAGRRYGHALMIHAIIDGTVYFMESYSLTIGGKYFREGSPVSCSIEEFARYYTATTISFDGVVHFSQQGYADRCKAYPSNLSVICTGGELMSQPCETMIDKDSTLVRKLLDGEPLQVTGVYQNSMGEYWYRVGEKDGYVRADRTRMESLILSDISITGTVAPTILRQGNGYQVKGVIASRFNSVYTVRAQVYKLGEEQTPVLSVTDMVEGMYYDLSGSSVSKDLMFRTLPAGQYRYELAVIVDDHYVQAGQLNIGWETVELWSSEFQVVEESGELGIITLDAKGGSVALDQTVVPLDTPLQSLPVPQLAGSVFQGWYTEDGVRVEPHTVPQGDMTLYAHWIEETALYEAWNDHGKSLYYYSDGVTTMGSILVDGIVYYFSSVGTMGQGRVLWTAAGVG